MPSTAPISIKIVGIDEFSKRFKKVVDSAKKIGAAVEGVGKKLTTTITTPLLGIGVASLKMSKDFNAAMAMVGTLIPNQIDRLNNLKKGVLDLSVATGQSSKVIAEGLYETISAFGDAADPMQKLAVATKMSVAGGSSVKEALSLMSAVTKGYGDTTDEAAQKASDLAFLTVKLGQTTFPELAASIGKVVPLSAALGDSQENLFAHFATLTGVTGNAAEAATQLASAYSAFVTPSGAMKKAVKDLGYSSSIAMVKTLGLNGALQKLKEHVKGDEEALGKLTTRKEAFLAAITTLGPQAESLTDKIEKMKNATGSTDDAYAQITDGINKSGHSFDRMVERFKKMAVVIGDKLTPVVNRLMDRIDPLLDRFDKMSPATLELGIKIAGVVAAIGPLVMITGKLISVGSAVAGAFGSAGGLAGIMAAVTGPIGAAVAAIVGLVAAVIYFRDELQPIGSAILEPFADAFNYLKDTLFSTEKGSTGLLASLKPIISFMARLTAPVVKLGIKLALLPLKLITKQLSIAGSIFGVVSSAVSVLVKAVRFALTWLDSLWTSFAEGTEIGQTLKGIFDWIGETISSVWDKVKNLWGTVSDFFGGIKGFLDSVGVEIDAATRKQELSVKSDVMNRIEAGEKQSTININFENMPNGASAKVTKASGAKARVKTKGPINVGAL